MEPASPRPIARRSATPTDGILPFPTTTPTTTSTPAFPSAQSETWHSLLPRPRDLLPYFITSSATPSKIRSTSWVDGLRGLAAFLVLIFHFTYRMTNTNLAWGANDDSDTRVLWRLPVLRLLSSGSAMVSLFFLISGYALSLRPLQLIRAAHRGRTESRVPTSDVTRHLASALIRRPIRLFVPVVFSAVLIFMCVRLGLSDWTRPVAENKSIFPITPQETHVETKSNIFLQFAHLFTELRDLMHNAFWENFFGGNFEYDQHMWTIPVELRSSCLLFGSLIPCIFMSEDVRYWYWAGLIGWTVDGGNWQMCLFFTGAVVAEWNLRQPQETATGSASPPETPLLLMLSLLILSYPEEHAETTPLYRYLYALTYPSFGQDFRFWQCLGGGVLFATISVSPVLKRPLESALMQYLGRISYGLYLMHGPVIHTVGFGMIGMLHGNSEAELSTMEYFIALAVTSACSIWAGDIWWRFVDLRAIAWARKASERILTRQ
ncbi:MAG: hypothetical protein Q9159_001466 [Coniocarpon cinnabarinum]